MLHLVGFLTLCAVQGDGPPADTFTAPKDWKPLGQAVWFDARERRLIIRARVCLRDGYLEHLLCKERTKEHEAILATEAPPRMIHAGLILAVGEPGHPIRYRPTLQLPTGPPVAITVEWLDDQGKPRTADARTWIKDDKSAKTLEDHWVFAGSNLFKHPDTGEMVYAADGGDLITVANFPSAILDLPVRSTDQDAERLFVANTPLIPPRNTYVSLILHAAPGTAPATTATPPAPKAGPTDPPTGANKPAADPPR
jgi:hypothetical protein